ncbi:hypothetical protein COCNU_scaffold000125G000020 [Cocos nucifera]|nr:hypothetical protein [Cocos nucifera]
MLLFHLWLVHISASGKGSCRLDCIGSAFNAKGAMQCPNCRKVEKGRWLYANGHRTSSDFDFDGWVTEDIYDLGYSELNQSLQLCRPTIQQIRLDQPMDALMCNLILVMLLLQPFGIQWCPFRGFTQLASLFENADLEYFGLCTKIGKTLTQGLKSQYWIPYRYYADISTHVTSIDLSGYFIFYVDMLIAFC